MTTCPQSTADPSAQTDRSASLQFVPSRFNVMATTAGDGLTVLNTFTGAILEIQGPSVATAKRYLTSECCADDGTPTFQHLVRAGMLTTRSSDELRKARFLSSHATSRADHLHLILFSTEECNFRCTYCYEDFQKGAMPPAVREAVCSLLRRRMPKLASLSLDWFGGEPLAAVEVIRHIAPVAHELAKKHDVSYSSHITTNGYLLDAPLARQLISWGVSSFQITLDGLSAQHDERRKLHVVRQSTAGGGTFERIQANVRELLTIRELFGVTLRVNYDRESAAAVPQFIDWAADLFADDPRVRVDFQPIWVVHGEAPVSVCMGRERQLTQVAFFEHAHARGLRIAQALEAYSPGGYVCYAAKANSIVVRSDGRLNKCTVALRDAYNDVGRLGEDGSLELDLDTFSLWTNSGMDTDSTCQSCFMAPSCQGNACPLDRIANKRRPCPTPKHFTERLVPLLVRRRSRQSEE